MITVRRASLKDSLVVSKLLKKKYNFSSLVEARKCFQEELKNKDHFRVAETESGVVGLISWRSQGTLRHGVAELRRLAVLSDYSDPLAVKEALFDVMLAEADNYYREHGWRLRKVFSLIHADSRNIKRFFIDKGMQQEAVLRNHYYPGRDELVFSLFLT